MATLSKEDYEQLEANWRTVLIEQGPLFIPGMKDDQQAHAMSHPALQKQERQHISDAAWEARVKTFPQTTSYIGRDEWENDHVLAGTVLLTVAEHEALEARLLTANQANDALRADRDTYRDALRLRMSEFDALRAEVDNLRAELAARTQAWDGEEWKLRLELSTLRDQIERLRKGVMPNAEKAEGRESVRSGSGNAVAGDASAKTRELFDALLEKQERLGPEFERVLYDNLSELYERDEQRLRKEREDEANQHGCVRAISADLAAAQAENACRTKSTEGNNPAGGSGERARVAQRLSAANELSSVVSVSLNPRLGIPQPDGDPVAPMSARKAYRWGMM